MPLATYTGWALRRGVHANDGCEANGQYIPFPKTQADRLASGDPRLSVQERYASYDGYRSKVMAAVNELVKKRFMLCEDADAYVQARLDAGVAAGVPAATTTYPDNTVSACKPKPPGGGGGHGGGGHGGHGHH